MACQPGEAKEGGEVSRLMEHVTAERHTAAARRLSEETRSGGSERSLAAHPLVDLQNLHFSLAVHLNV